MVTNLNGVRVRCVLWHYHRSTLHGVGTSSSAHDATRKVGQRCGRSEGDLVKNSGLGSIRQTTKAGHKGTHLVVVLHKDATTRKDGEEGIEVVGIRTLEPIHEQESGATGWCGQDLEIWDRCAIAAFLTTNDEDAPVRHDHSAWVPALLRCLV